MFFGGCRSTLVGPDISGTWTVGSGCVLVLSVSMDPRSVGPKLCLLLLVALERYLDLSQDVICRFHLAFGENV